MDATIEEIEDKISHLSNEKLKQFRAWYEKFDSKNWDEQIEKDINDGKLNDIAAAAIAEYKAGKSRFYILFLE